MKSKKRIIITGASGQVGSDLSELLSRSHDVVKLESKDFDFTRTSEIKLFLKDLGEFDYLVNCMAMTNTGECEENISRAFALNSFAPLEMAKLCHLKNKVFIHLSTDYVFDGLKESSYTECDLPSPLSIYGSSKLSGENHVRGYSEKYFILRTSSVYGVNSKHGNFVDFMLKKYDAKEEISVVSDQYMSPTHSLDIARSIVQIIDQEKKNYGLYHLSGEGVCSWYEFSQEIFKILGLDKAIAKVSWKDFSSKLVRPQRSDMKNSFMKMSEWKEGLKEYLELKGRL